jgi:HPt (histidine-containing phosphotransfer) domain-containing protein
MTAFAMEHERQACYEAGMNDHIGKPFEPNDFLRLLAKWIAPEHQCRREATADDDTGDRASAMPSIEGIDTAAGLARFAGNEAAYRQWLDNFLAEGPAPIAKIREELDAGRREQALRALHAYKGRCGMLGFTSLWQAVVELESRLKGDEEFAMALAAAESRLRELLGRLIEARKATDTVSKD